MILIDFVLLDGINISAVSKHEKTHCAEILDELKELLGITWLQSGFPASLVEVLSVIINKPDL